MVADGAMNGDLFRAYVEQVLVPELRPGDVVVMDNLGSHMIAGVRRAIEAAECRLLFLPPYCPDFNPIENAFSKLKRLLRSVAERTVDRLWRAIGRLLDRSPRRVPELLPPLRLYRYSNLKCALICAMRTQRVGRQPPTRQCVESPGCRAQMSSGPVLSPRRPGRTLARSSIARRRFVTGVSLP